MEHLLNGLYRATNSDEACKVYFTEQIGLAEFCFELLKKPCSERTLFLCNEIITEYFSYLASEGLKPHVSLCQPFKWSSFDSENVDSFSRAFAQVQRLPQFICFIGFEAFRVGRKELQYGSHEEHNQSAQWGIY